MVSSSSSSSFSPLAPLQSQIKRSADVHPSIVALKSFFSASKTGELKQSIRTGAGVFVDRALIVTSAHVVGNVSNVHDSDRGSTVHNCFIGRTVAVTTDGKVLKTKLVAVDFGGDVAVLEVEGDLPPPCVVASSVASKEVPLVVITRHENCNGCGILQMKVRALEDNSGRTEWPYKLDDGLGWARYGGAHIYDKEIVPGSPWFSPDHQVVGIASYAAGNEEANSVGGFVVPPPRIRSVVDYAKRKGPDDPIVLNRWINAVIFADPDAADLAKEGIRNVPIGFVMTTYL